MRQVKLYLTLLLLIMLGSSTASAVIKKAWSSTDGVFYLKTSDGLEEYTVDGSITFKCVADGKTIPGYRDAGVVFAPKNEGELIQITVKSIDLDGGNYLCVYNGAIEAIRSGVSDGVDQSRYLPAGWKHKLTKGNVGLEYTSESADGKLSFGFHSGSANGQTGWEITVTSLSPKDMEYVSATALDGKSGIYRGGNDQPVFGARVVTDGGKNPLTLNNLTISTAALTGSAQVENVRLYKGDKFTDDNLLATSATLGDALTATNVALKSSNNDYWVVANVLPDASGSIPSLEVTALTVAGEARTLTAATAQELAIANTVLMQKDHKVYTVGDDINFYDDGGKDGKIGEKFEGSVTFVPATAGNAIKVDFSKLAIFNTSTVGYNDIFNFYNGREADEANLITTLLKDAKAVKSTAEDGSMTITLKSTTGVPAAGWEAIVSQFLPGDMTFKAINAGNCGVSDVAAGQTDVHMLIVDVVTDNQSNPLSLSQFTFAGESMPAEALAGIKVYALGEKPEVKTTDLFGQADAAASMTVNGEYTLVEGHNYFAVLADVAEGASNDDIIKVTLTGATVAGEARTPESPVTSQVDVTNVCRMTQGSHSHNIHDEWTLTDTKSPYNPTYYDYVNAVHQVTFVPTVENSVIELDFSKFDVYYASSSYGTKAVFKVYSGETTAADNLLWELNDASQQKVGPGRILRSTAANGAMTIVFNPNTTSSYYAGTGFEASVRPFVNHNMEVKEVTVNQTSSEIISTGATGADLIDFNVVTEGTLTLKTIKGITLDLKDNYEAVSKVTVLYSGDKATADEAVEFGTADVTSQQVTVAGEKVLADGSNHFWVKVDIKNDAQPELAVDARLVSLTDAEGNAIAVENGDPEGSRTTKSMYIMQEGTNVVTVVNPIMFYDNGGPAENFTKGFNGTVTFVPGKENCGIVIDSKSFATGSSSYNKFGLFNGRTADEANRVGTATTYYATYGPQNVISEAEDGSLTVTFNTSTASYASVTAGWEIDVRLHEYKPLAVETVEASSAKDGDIVRGSINEPIAKVKVDVVNDNQKVELNNIKFNTTGTTALSDIKAARLYFSGNVADFTTDNLVAETATVGEELTFTAESPVEITKRGTYYLWLAYDIDENAAAGNAVAAQLVSLDGCTDTTAVTAPAITRNIKAGFKGTYTIGKSDNADYATFAAAVAAMSVGVEGNVRFEVEDGTYAENIVLNSIPGTNANHTVTFAGKSGNRDAVVVTGSGNVGSITVEGSDVKQGMVFVNATPYVTFEAMSFVPASQSYPHAVHYFNKSGNFTLRNCVVKADPILSGYSGMNLVKGECTKANGNVNNNVTIENNLLSGGYIGVYAGAYGLVANMRETGLVVRGNTVTNAGSKGVYVMDEIGATVENNIITQSVTQKTSYSGIDIYRNKGQFVVRNNVIVNSHNAYSNGIYLRQESEGDANAPARVYNNVVAITASPTNSTAGAQINSDCNNIEFVYNTVSVAGTNGYTFYNGGSTSKWEHMLIANNIFQNTSTSGMGALFYSDEFMSKAVIENNAWYVASGTIVKDYAATIDALNSHDKAQNNWVEQAEFLSETDLHLMSAGTLVNGTAISYVDTDADGKTRAQVPTVGAYEFAEVVEEKPEIAEGYPTVSGITENSAVVKSNWSVGGKLYAKVVAQPAGEANAAPAAAPSVDDMLAVTPVDYTAGTDAESTFSDLTPSTTYKAFLMVESALGVKSDIVETEAFTTLRHIEPLVLYIEPISGTINAGETGSVYAMVEGGDQPYTWEWRDQMNNIVGDAEMAEVTPDYTRAYFVKVTSADGQTVEGKTAVIVHGEAVTATFDDYYLPEETAIIPVDDDVLYSGSYGFHGFGGSYGSSTTYWNGFAFANKTASTFASLNDQYNTSMGGGRDSEGYCIAYPYGVYSIDVTNSVDGDVIKGMYISNNAYAMNSILHGDGFSQPFKKGSWFKVTATGKAADGTSKTVDFYLADYRSENALDHYALDTWQWMDLSSLGKVKSIHFTMSGSDNSQWGLNTPAYFAMDDFNGTRDEITASHDMTVGESTLDLTEYFELDNDGSTIAYEIENQGEPQSSINVLEDEPIEFTIDGNNLNINATEADVERTVVVKVTQKGKSQYLRLTVSVTSVTSIGDLNVSSDKAYKTIENGQVIIVKGDKRYNTMGQKVVK
ncbi:MAG: DUF4465 domain-containing protein [Bacteroidales bacterium]|nr:DUF4465 domain-containing protein [Candidatus Sodaliphilus limicaballi]